MRTYSYIVLFKDYRRENNTLIMASKKIKIFSTCKRMRTTKIGKLSHYYILRAVLQFVGLTMLHLCVSRCFSCSFRTVAILYVALLYFNRFMGHLCILLCADWPGLNIFAPSFSRHCFVVKKF